MCLGVVLSVQWLCHPFVVPDFLGLRKAIRKEEACQVLRLLSLRVGMGYVGVPRGPGGRRSARSTSIWRPPARAKLGAGLRPGEICFARAKDVSIDNTTVVVTARDGRRVPVLDEEREVLAVLASALEQDEYLFHRGQADRD